MLKLYFSTSPSFYVSGYNLKLIVGQKLWLLTVIGFMTWLHLWYGTVARMTLPPSPGQSPLSSFFKSWVSESTIWKMCQLMLQVTMKMGGSKKESHTSSLCPCPLLHIDLSFWLLVLLPSDPAPEIQWELYPSNISLILYHSCWFCFCHGPWLLQPLKSMI